MKKQKGLGLILILALFVLVISNTSLRSLNIGYLTGTQGLEANFNSIYWKVANRDLWWSQTESPIITPELEPLGFQNCYKSFGYEMSFNPDGATGKMPTINCGQQPMTVKSDVEPKKYTWQVYSSSTTFSNGTTADVYKQFEMYRYEWDWALNLWLSGSGDEALGIYSSLEIWLKLVPRAFVFFLDNPEHVYFAPVYIGLESDAEYVGIDQSGTKFLDDPEIERISDIYPEAKGETCGIYYQRGAVDTQLTESELLKYKDIKLDPEIFRNEYWIRLKLLNFQAINWYLWYAHNWKYPSAHLDFKVYIYVVGEWKVYFKTGEVPVLEPHEPPTFLDNPALWIEEFFGAVFANPLFWTVIILIILAIFAPSVLKMILDFIKDIVKGGKKK